MFNILFGGKLLLWLGIVMSAVAVFGYLHSRGVSPVCVAVAVVCFPGFFRFIYRLACLVVAAVIIMAICSYLIY